MMRRSKVREAAHRERCTLQIAGCCNGDPDTTVLCHIGMKDFGGTAKRRRVGERNAVFACSACHDAIDGRTKYFLADNIAAQESMRADRWEYIARALIRTAERRDELGL